MRFVEMINENEMKRKRLLIMEKKYHLAKLQFGEKNKIKMKFKP